MSFDRRGTAYKLIVTLFFICQPFLTSWGAYVHQIFKSRNNLSRFSSTLLCVSVALIATSKLPESDLLYYLTAIENANVLNRSDYFSQYNREPIYFGALYLLGLSGLVSKTFFVFISVFTIMYLTTKAIHRLGAALGASENLILAVIGIALLYPSYFDLAGHLLRQMLAGSLVMLGLTYSGGCNRRHIILLATAVLIHYSALFLVVVASLKAPRKLSPFVGLIAIVMVLLCSVYLLRALAPLALDIPYLSQIAARLIYATGAELESIPILKIALLFTAFAAALYCLTIYRVTSELPSAEKIIKTTIVLCAFVFGASLFPELSELALRFYFYIYFFSPMILVIICQKSPFLRRPVQGIACLMPAVFLIGLHRSNWTYSLSGYDILSPLWFLW